jgi:hypothetical protein
MTAKYDDQEKIAEVKQENAQDEPGIDRPEVGRGVAAIDENPGDQKPGKNKEEINTGPT